MNAWTTLVAADVLLPRVAAGTVALFDCRFDLFDADAGRRRFLAGHLPGAAYLHLDTDLSGPANGRNGRHPLPDRRMLAARLARAGLRRGQQAVVYDEAGGAVAARAWWLLRWLGHGEVAVLDGGLAAWVAAGGSLAAGEGVPAVPGDLAASTEPGMPVVEAQTLLADLPSRTLRLLDARTPARFAGEPHPLDPVPGHIPGARSRFFGDNLAADGRFKPAEVLRRGYEAVLGDAAPERTAVYCGSGVTAAHDLLAMEHAGLPGAALYPGSWSEWSSDAGRPVER